MIILQEVHHGCHYNKYFVVVNILFYVLNIPGTKISSVGVVGGGVHVGW